MSNVVKLRVDSSEYESKINRARQGLVHLGQSLHDAGKSFVDADKDSIAFIRELGKMETVSRTTRGRIGEMNNAFIDLKRVYNEMTEAERRSPAGQAMAKSLEELKQRAQEAQSELKELKSELEGMKVPDIAGNGGGGGLFGEGGLTGMLQVAGGNLLSTGIEKLIGGLSDAWAESIELAKAGEGVRIAFERLNQPGLLDRLKEATHGTVSEVELMKQAIQFENFKLPLDDLATYLAFAQQKAKDTGQSIDYLVNSIVTGLGRQSKQILDNLGISAAELTRRMNEGADMTTAVADIIREEMAKAGDYIETAADKAARAAADATNEMEKFGQSAAPIAEEWGQVWNALSIGAMDFAGTLLGPVADSIRSIQNILNTTFDDRQIQFLEAADKLAKQQQADANKKNSGGIKTAPGGYVEVTDKNTGVVIGGQHFENLNDSNTINEWKKKITKSGGGKTGGKTTTTVFDETSIAAQEKLVSELTKKWKEAGEAVRDDYKKQLDEARQVLSVMNGGFNPSKVGEIKDQTGQTPMAKLAPELKIPVKLELGDVTPLRALEDRLKDLIAKQEEFGGVSSEVWQEFQAQIDETKEKIDDFKGNKKPKGKENPYLRKNEDGKMEAKLTDVLNGVAGGMQQMVGGLESLGFEIPEGFKSAISAVQGVTSILSGIATTVLAIEAIAGADALIPFARGGVVPHAAAGYFVGGSHYSGDVTPVLANAGELILNKSSQNNLASILNDVENGNSRGNGFARVSGEHIYIALSNYLMRKGKGELVTWR